MSSPNPKTMVGGLISGVLLFMAIFTINIQINGVPIEITPPSFETPPRAEYTSVDPITIGGSEDWATYPFITGTGTDEDPYIIADVEITGAVENRTFSGDRSAFGIAVYDQTAAFQIQNCKLTNWHIGIFTLTLGSLTSKIIQDNEISHCGIGINVYGENFRITSNTIEECHTDPENRLAMIYLHDHQGPYTFGGAGIWADFTGQSLEISYNTIRNCEVGVMMPGPGWLQHNQLENCGVMFERPRLFTISVENNTVNGLPLGFFMGEDDVILNGDEQQYGQLVIAGCQNVMLSNLEIAKTTFGFYFEMNNNLTVTNLVAEECLVGVYLFDFGPISPGTYEKLIIEELTLRNCLVGLQFMIRYAQVPETVYTTEFTIAEAADNDYDILLAPDRTIGVNLTVPAGSKVLVDRHMGYLDVEVKLEGVAYGNVENVTSLLNYYDETLYATLATLEDVGEYSIVSELTVAPGEIHPFHNLTIFVVSAGFSIPGYDLGWLGWSVTIGSLVGLAVIDKKRFQ
ncbi:MAG: right-handed parallel beta-helix repeat-containing protein [Promethearchaeota archaeon]